MPSRLIRIATRTSDLALWQAHYVADRLMSLEDPPDVEIVHITTSGDQNQAVALSQFGGTGAFTKEVQTAVLDDRADIAVHSLKDLPTEPTAGLSLAGVPERASTYDALLCPQNSERPKSILDLPTGFRIGTGSPRRAAQLLKLNPRLKVADIRGNVPTRLRKLDDGEFDGIVLAEAGLDRLNLTDRSRLRLGPPDFYGAVGQGALGIECRTDDTGTAELLARLSCISTKADVTAERALLNALRAGCHAPVGVETSRVSDLLRLTGVLLSLDGATCLKHTASGSPEEAVQLGQKVAEELMQAGGESLLGASPGN